MPITMALIHGVRFSATWSPTCTISRLIFTPVMFWAAVAVRRVSVIVCSSCCRWHDSSIRRAAIQGGSVRLDLTRLDHGVVAVTVNDGELGGDRSEERRVGNGWVSTGRSRRWPEH